MFRELLLVNARDLFEICSRNMFSFFRRSKDDSQYLPRSRANGAETLDTSNYRGSKTDLNNMERNRSRSDMASVKAASVDSATGYDM